MRTRLLRRGIVEGIEALLQARESTGGCELIQQLQRMAPGDPERCRFPCGVSGCERVDAPTLQHRDELGAERIAVVEILSSMSWK